MKNILVTGAAGFIGSNLIKALYKVFNGITVVGVDSVNDYYDVNLKEERLKELEQFNDFIFVRGNIADRTLIDNLFEKYNFEIVVNNAGCRHGRFWCVSSIC